MNELKCIICHESIDEHVAGALTDCCITWAIGQKSTGSYHMWSQFDELMGDLIHHLTADDNPVEHVTIGWDRSDSKWYVGMQGWYPLGSDKPDGYYSVTADTLPLALCRAVLTLAVVEAGDE